MTPHVCPVCQGRGRVRADVVAATEVLLERCPACHGACIVWEPDAGLMPTFYPTEPPK